MEPFNNSFPNFYSLDKYDNMEVELEEKSNLSAFNLNFLKIFEHSTLNNNLNNTCKEFNLSPSKKKSSLDISYSIMEQTFCENSHINIEEEFQQQNEYLKIGNEGQNPCIPCIDPIQEVDSFERENNESFLHENNYLLDNFDDNSNSFEVSSNQFTNEMIKFDSTLEETEISKIRKNIIGLKFNKNNSGLNKSYTSGNYNFNQNKKQIFSIFNNNKLNTTNNITNQINNKSSLNLTNSSYHNSNNPLKLNLSCNINLSEIKKRGRKKFLFDGVKTEIIDKAFIREFKLYVKKSKSLFKSVYDDLKNEEKIFWNEFMQTNNPPFNFTENKQKIEYKSFSKSLLKFLFSHNSVKNLYQIFIREKEKEIVDSIVNKKVKKIDRKMLLFYSFYGKNLHKLYSNDYNINDINIEDFETAISTSVGSNISDSIIIVNTSISN